MEKQGNHTFLLETEDSIFIVDGIRDIMIRAWFYGDNQHGRWMVTYYGHIDSHWI